MESAISNAISLCPEFNVTSLIQATFNNTTFPNPIENIPKFYCKLKYLTDYEIPLVLSIVFFMYLVATCLGIPGCILALITLYTEEFNTVSFFYLRVINILEVFYITSLFLSFLDWYNNDWYHRSLFFAIHYCYIATKVDAVFKISMDIIVAWVGVERALLCNSPRWFEKVNKRSVAWAIVMAVLLCTCLFKSFGLPLLTFTYDNATGLYNRFSNVKYSQSKIFTIYIITNSVFNYVESMILLLSTILTIQGLVKISRRKKKLITSAGFQSASAKELMKQISINKQLCLLQACEAIPTTVDRIFGVGRNFAFGNPVDLNIFHLSSMTLEQAERNLALQRTSNVLNICVTGLTALVHGTHFYRYFMFSHKFRKVAIRTLWRRNEGGGASGV